ncbi:hypothetical protein ACLOJK_010150 [Asimina triloba]
MIRLMCPRKLLGRRTGTAAAAVPQKSRLAFLGQPTSDPIISTDRKGNRRVPAESPLPRVFPRLVAWISRASFRSEGKIHPSPLVPTLVAFVSRRNKMTTELKEEEDFHFPHRFRSQRLLWPVGVFNAPEVFWPKGFPSYRPRSSFFPNLDDGWVGLPGGRMKELTPDLSDPQAIMDSEFFPGKGTFAFAFDNNVFSDRVLRIEVVASPADDKADGDGCSSVAEWARNRKRRREDIKKDNADRSSVRSDFYSSAKVSYGQMEREWKRFDLVAAKTALQWNAGKDTAERSIAQDIAPTFFSVNDFTITLSYSFAELAIYPDEHVLNCNQPDSDDGVVYDNQDEEAMAMVEESPVGVGMVASPAGSKTKSPFFYKLFSNGMRESEQRHITLRVSESARYWILISLFKVLDIDKLIHVRQEVAVIELLNFMYSETLSTTTAPALLDVLMAADKFEVASCMRYCCRLLRSLPMTPESALLYLELPSSVRKADAVQPLTDAAKQFLATHYKDLSKHQDEVLNLPLVGIEVVLGSDDLQVPSEDAIYDFVLKWARAQYTKPEERREILDTRLIRLVRFPYMTCRKLKKVLTCNEFDKELAGKAVLDALFFKAETPHRQRSLLSDDSGNRRLVERERAYKYRPVKVVEFEQPYKQCIVYLDVKREECANLFPCGRLYSQAFHLGGQGFFLSAHCNMDQLSSFHCFGLFLGMQEKGSVSLAVDYEFAARTKPTGDFLSKYKGNYTFTGGKAVGYRNLFATPWTSFIAEDSHFFINDTLHLRAELTIRKQPC